MAGRVCILVRHLDPSRGSDADKVFRIPLPPDVAGFAGIRSIVGAIREVRLIDLNDGCSGGFVGAHDPDLEGGWVVVEYISQTIEPADEGITVVYVV